MQEAGRLEECGWEGARGRGLPAMVGKLRTAHSRQRLNAWHLVSFHLVEEERRALPPWIGAVPGFAGTLHPRAFWKAGEAGPRSLMADVSTGCTGCTRCWRPAEGAVHL